MRSTSMARHLVASVVVLVTLVAPSGPTYATDEALSRCLADNTSGRDRKDLARWVFFAMAAHPEFKQYTVSTARQGTQEAHKTVGAMFTRLVTESCVHETRTAFSAAGTKAIHDAFQTLGGLAMQELMSNGDVSATMGAVERHIDQNKLNQALGRQ